MKKIPFYNDADHMVFMGGVMVPPGETRLVDESLLQPASAPAAEDDDGTTDHIQDKLVELLKNKQDDVLKALPDLSLEEVELLGDLEQAGQARKGILGAVAERLLASAAEQQ